MTPIMVGPPLVRVRCRTCGYDGGCPPSHTIDNTGDADALYAPTQEFVPLEPPPRALAEGETT